jgi:acyl dehydratase
MGMTHREGAFVGETFESAVTLSKDDISTFAEICGDKNRLHHDEVAAAKTRFGGVIASATQTIALFMAMVATHFSRTGPMLGIEFSFRFQGPARPGMKLRMSWQVVGVEWKNSLNGDLVTLQGRISDSNANDLVTSTGKIVVMDEPWIGSDEVA